MLELHKSLEVETIMKLRPASLHLPAQFHLPLRFGRRWRNHELPLRLIQLVLFVLLAAVAARTVGNGVAMAVKAISGFVS
ncbi:MAG: hypothetical protein EOP92_03935 [Lysobacteraceae bacterium]|nr:MAG: hypothetical protein EOP92_03935 [Xanthomonadaceae bacterium]